MCQIDLLHYHNNVYSHTLLLCLLCIYLCFHSNGKRWRGAHRDLDQSEEFFANLRNERERVACIGVPEVWGLSPTRPDME